MQSGKMLAVNKPDNLIKSYVGNLFAVSANNMHKLNHDLENLEDTNLVFRFGDTIHITSNITDDKSYTSYIHQQLEKAGYSNIKVNKIEPIIEDCFLALMDKDVIN